MKTWINVIGWLMLPLLAFADDEAERAVVLSVKPLLCIVDQRAPACDMTFVIRWHSEENGYYCVFNDEEDDALGCWRDERAGETEDRRSVRENLDFWINESNGAPLDTVTVEVLRLDSDDRRRRRRSRHVWDLL